MKGFGLTTVAKAQEHRVMVPFNSNRIKPEFVAAQIMGQVVQPLFLVPVKTRCLTSMRFQNVPRSAEGFVREMSCSVTYVVVLEVIVMVTKFGHLHQVNRNS